MTRVREWSPKQRELRREIIAGPRRHVPVVGAIASGKSEAACQALAVRSAMLSPDMDVCIAARSAKVLQRTVLPAVVRGVESYGGTVVRRAEHWECTSVVPGKPWRIIAAIGNNDAAAELISGSNLAAAYVDEATLVPRSLVTELKQRVRVGRHPKLVYSMNADAPTNFMKVEVVDRVADGTLDGRYFEFHHADNPSLNADIVAGWDGELTGHVHKRMMLNLWVATTGAVFPHAAEAIRKPPKPETETPLGVRWGLDIASSSITAAVLLAAYSGGRWWVVAEHTIDGREGSPVPHPEQMRQIVAKFAATGLPAPSSIAIDPSAVDARLALREALRDHGWHIEPEPADNDIVAGTRWLSRLIDGKRLRIAPECRHTINDLVSLRWDETAAETGADVIDKKSTLVPGNHHGDAIRYAMIGLAP